MIVADDAVLFREGVTRLLADSGVSVVAQAGDADSLLASTRSERPDVVVTDIRMPPSHTTEGLDAAIQIRDEMPGVAILVLSQHLETLHVTELLGDERGGVGYLLKERVTDVAVLCDALDRLHRGDAVIDPEVVAVTLGRRRRGQSAIDRLSSREREILALMAEGRSNRAIAEALFVGHKTLETHVRNIFTKLDLPPTADDHRRVLAVLAHLRR